MATPVTDTPQEIDQSELDGMGKGEKK